VLGASYSSLRSKLVSACWSARKGFEDGRLSLSIGLEIYSAISIPFEGSIPSGGIQVSRAPLGVLITTFAYNRSPTSRCWFEPAIRHDCPMLIVSYFAMVSNDMDPANQGEGSNVGLGHLGSRIECAIEMEEGLVLSPTLRRNWDQRQECLGWVKVYRALPDMPERTAVCSLRPLRGTRQSRNTS